MNDSDLKNFLLESLARTRNKAKNELEKITNNDFDQQKAMVLEYLEELDRVYLHKDDIKKPIMDTKHALASAWVLSIMGGVAIKKGLSPCAIRAIEVSNKCLGINFGNIAINKTALTLQKYQKAPKAKQDKTAEFWAPYINQFNNYIEAGKSESWARNKIGTDIENSGTWAGNKKRPNRSTLTRHLSTK